MQHTAGDLADMLKGLVEGDSQVIVNQLSKIELASLWVTYLFIQSGL